MDKENVKKLCEARDIILKYVHEQSLQGNHDIYELLKSAGLILDVIINQTDKDISKRNVIKKNILEQISFYLDSIIY